MNLIDDVLTYYKKYFDELSFDKQFHFASRLNAWSDDSFCKEALLTDFKEMTRDGDTNAIKTDLRLLLTNPPNVKINAAATREHYFAKYPTLRGRMLALFRVRHLLFIYGIDARHTLLELCPLTELLQLSTTLHHDADAIKVLSTYAINYIYLIHDILFREQTPSSAIPQIAHTLGETYDISQPEHIQLLIYLYTHCIIGETNFYQQTILRHRLLYTTMLKELESIIDARFESINLDNKLEFLVCCRILEIATPLFERIYAECEQSVSAEGTFIVDTLNSYKQSNKTSLSDSEHRNVLFIMSGSRYRHADGQVTQNTGQ